MRIRRPLAVSHPTMRVNSARDSLIARKPARRVFDVHDRPDRRSPHQTRQYPPPSWRASTRARRQQQGFGRAETHNASARARTKPAIRRRRLIIEFKCPARTTGDGAANFFTRRSSVRARAPPARRERLLWRHSLRQSPHCQSIHFIVTGSQESNRQRRMAFQQPPTQSSKAASISGSPTRITASGQKLPTRFSSSAGSPRANSST